MESKPLLDPTHIRALLFDIDGTLSDTDDLYVQRLARWLAPGRRLFGRSEPLDWARRIVMRLETPANLIYEWLDRLRLDEVFHFFFKRGRRDKKSYRPFTAIPGINDLLQSLQGRFLLAVVSSRSERSTRAFLRQFDLEKYFQVIVTGQTCRQSKPHPQPLLYAAQLLQVDISTCVMIGDTTVDIRAGKRAGCRTVGVLCGFGEEPELRRAGAHVILSSPIELREILLGK